MGIHTRIIWHAYYLYGYGGGWRNCAANFITATEKTLSMYQSQNHYWVNSQYPRCLHPHKIQAQMCQLMYIPVAPFTIWCKTSRLSLLMIVAGFKPVISFSPSPSPQFLQVHHTCRYVHMHTHALQHAHKLSLFIVPLYMYLSFPNLNDEQIHPHSESITSNQLVDSQHSTEPSKSHFLQRR